MNRMLTSLVASLAFVFGSTAGALAQEKKPVKPEAAPAAQKPVKPEAAQGQKPVKPEGGVAGVVKKVDDKSITLAIVTQKGQPAEEKAFEFAADAKISVLGKDAKRTEIVIDKPAQLTLNADKKVAAVTQADKGVKPEKGAGGISGVVKKVDDKAITLAVVTMKGQPAEDQTFTFAATVKVSVLGKEAKATEVAVDKQANLVLDADKKVVAINQGSPDKGNKGEKAPGVSGTLKKVDDKSVTIAVVTMKGQPAQEQTFQLAADVKVAAIGNGTKIADLKVDVQVQLKLDADKKVVALAQAEKGQGDKGAGGGINGVVKKIDDKANTITLAITKVKGQPAEEQTFSIAADAKIVSSGKPAKLSEIEADKPANVVLNADKKVTVIAQGKGEKPQK